MSDEIQNEAEPNRRKNYNIPMWHAGLKYIVPVVPISEDWTCRHHMVLISDKAMMNEKDARGLTNIPPFGACFSKQDGIDIKINDATDLMPYADEMVIRGTTIAYRR